MMIPNHANHFLSSIGLSIDAQQHTVVEGETIDALSQGNHDNIISIVCYYGLLSINGPDTPTFLQGQTTSDVSLVTTNHSGIGAYCTPKGRVISSFLLARKEPNEYLLRMRSSVLQSTQSTFSKYIVFSKAEQSIKSDQYACICIAGETAQSTIRALFNPDSPHIYQTTWLNDNAAIQLDADGLIYECWILQSNLEQLWPQLSKGLELKGSRYWELLSINMGSGEVSDKTADMFIPQMLNYQVTGAVSFTKGCYTGQEIVARMQYKGKLKRPMYRIKIAKNQGELKPGSDLYPATPPFSAGQTPSSIGNIVNVVNLSDGSSEALAVISSKNFNDSGVVAGKRQYPVEILSLPYAITNGEN
jgi:folate-binding protein YgfZ